MVSVSQSRNNKNSIRPARICTEQVVHDEPLEKKDTQQNYLPKLCVGVYCISLTMQPAAESPDNKPGRSKDSAVRNLRNTEILRNALQYDQLKRP